MRTRKRYPDSSFTPQFTVLVQTDSPLALPFFDFFRWQEGYNAWKDILSLPSLLPFPGNASHPVCAKDRNTTIVRSKLKLRGTPSLWQHNTTAYSKFFVSFSRSSLCSNFCMCKNNEFAVLLRREGGPTRGGEQQQTTIRRLLVSAACLLVAHD